MRSTPPKTPRKQIGPAVAALLNHKSCTQAHVAQSVGMSRAQISNFLSGHRDIHASTFVEILNTLGIDVMKLVRCEVGESEAEMDVIPHQLKLMPGSEVETLVQFLQVYKDRLSSDLDLKKKGAEIA